MTRMRPIKSLLARLLQSLASRARRKSKRATAAAAPAQPFRFLDLPPEIRNQIYHLCLVNREEYIALPAPLPALVASSRSCRLEATKMYYLANLFLADITLSDAVYLNRWGRAAVVAMRHYSNASDVYMQDIDLKVVIREPDWAGLVSWCREIHASRAFELDLRNIWPGREDDDTEGFVRRMMWSIMWKGDLGIPWEACRQYLEQRRASVLNLDRRWAL